jgi:hypothetical protein
MTNGLGFGAFYTNWIEAFKAVAKGPAPRKHDWWEGTPARKDLENSGFLMIVVPSWEPAPQPFTTFLQQVWEEVETYKRITGQVVYQNSQFREVLDFLDGTLKRCRKVEARMHVPSLSRKLHSLNRSLVGERQKVTKIYETHWRQELFKWWRPQKAKQFSLVDPETGLVWEAVGGRPPHVKHVEEEILKGLTAQQRLGREIDLDGFFQRRLARVLRFWLPDPKRIHLRTISRLVVLVYLCAELVEERGKNVRYRRGGVVSRVPELVTRQSNRVLSLGGLDQKLRAAGLR